MRYKTPKMYRSQLGALTEHHVIFHSRGAEHKMNQALLHSHKVKRRTFGY